MGTKGESNRQRIIDAANQLFYTRGYNQTSFRDISVATGIPRGNFYYYFKTKDDILGAVVDARVKSYGEMIAQVEQSTADPRERLLAFAGMMEQHSDDVIAVGCPVGSLSTELAKDNENLQSLSRAVFELIRDWMAAQFKQLNFDNADARAMDLLARMQGIAVITCAFKDKKFLQRSTAEIKTWINTLTLS